MKLPPTDRHEWTLLHEQIKKAIHTEECYRASAMGEEIGDQPADLAQSPWMWGGCNIAALALREWIHDESRVKQWIVCAVRQRTQTEQVMWGGGRTTSIPAHTCLSYRTTFGAVFFDAVIIGFGMANYRRKMERFYKDDPATRGDTWRHRIFPASRWHHDYMAGNFGPPPPQNDLQKIVSTLNLAIGRWPKGARPKTPWDVYDDNGVEKFFPDPMMPLKKKR